CPAWCPCRVGGLDLGSVAAGARTVCPVPVPGASAPGPAALPDPLPGRRSGPAGRVVAAAAGCAAARRGAGDRAAAAGRSVPDPAPDQPQGALHLGGSVDYPGHDGTVL